MTSHDDVEAVARAYDTGATDFLSKGVSNRLMIERVRFVLREFQSRRALEVSRARLAAAQDMARIGHWEVDGVGRTIDLSRLVGSLIGVEEGSSGSFYMGAGFSSVENLFGYVGMTQGNFDLFNPPSFTGGGRRCVLRMCL